MNGTYYVRKARNSVSKAKIAKHKSYELFRKNAKEFGRLSKAGKLLRDAVADFTREVSDKTTASRLTSLLNKIKALDTINVRGKRNLESAFAKDIAKKMLMGFEFNNAGHLSSILKKSYSVNTSTGVITIANLMLKRDLACPKGATHVAVKGIGCIVNFGDNAFVAEETNEEIMTINNIVSDVILSPVKKLKGTGLKIYLLRILFFQEVNGRMVLINEGRFRGCVVEEVCS
jgi:hypothetical protein